jgi:hypothetical protein
MLWWREKPGAVCGIGEERRPRLHGLEEAGVLRDASSISSMTALRDATPQRCRFVGVQVIDHQDPGRLSLRLDCLGDVRGTVGRRTGRTNGRCDDSAGGPLNVGQQRWRAMTDGRTCTPGNPAWPRGAGRVEPYSSVDAGCCLGPDPLEALGLALGGRRRQGAHRVALGITRRGGLGAVMMEPVPGSLRLEGCFF